MIYKGNTLINDIYVGSTKIGEVYKGSTLVSGYPSGTVLFESGVPGTYTINVKYKSVVHIDLCGSGGAGATSVLGSRGRTGGSAGYIYGDLFLVAGSYEITVASPSSQASSFNGNSANGGGNASHYNAGKDGSGGTTTIVSSGLTGSNGTTGSTTSRILTYGGGGYGGSSQGQAGYCKIVVV